MQNHISLTGIRGTREKQSPLTNLTRKLADFWQFGTDESDCSYFSSRDPSEMAHNFCNFCNLPINRIRLSHQILIRKSNVCYKILVCKLKCRHIVNKQFIYVLYAYCASFDIFSFFFIFLSFHVCAMNAKFVQTKAFPDYTLTPLMTIKCRKISRTILACYWHLSGAVQYLYVFIDL